MTLLSMLNNDIKVAMKAKDKDTLSVLRMMKATIQNEEIQKGESLSPEEELAVLSREMKQRKDSLNEFEKANRQDLVEHVLVEIDIVKKYMPQQLTEEELRELIQQAIISTKATSMQDFGKVMGAVMPSTKGKADGQQVNALVKELISSIH